MATATERSRLRSDIGANSTSLTDVEADEIFTEAGEAYTDAGSVFALTRVIAIRRLLADSAKLTSYRQNASSENLSDVFKHLKELLELWQGELEIAVAGTLGSAARFGGLRQKPGRVKRYPVAGMTRNA